MEVEARVSVQAMRGRFEQLHEESPVASSPAQKINTSSVRTRASSVINKDSSSSEEGKKAQGKLAYLTEANEQDQKHLGRGNIISGQETYISGSFMHGILSPLQSTSKNTRTPTARKYSIDSIRERREHTGVQTHDAYSHGLLNKSAGEKLDSCGAELRPSVVKRIPIFKSVDTGLNSESKKFTKEAGEETVADSQGKRGRLFGHIRSRSHGNFIIKRDSSVEKNSPNESVTKQKENVLNTDWLTPKRKQKGNDNLYNNQDSKSNSSFEGKQKIVANVVKNMKNKEKPKVLRKLSFSSKTEKELKNKKVKAVNSVSKERQTGPSLPSADKANRADNLKAKLEANTRFTKADEHKQVKDKGSNLQNTSHISGAAVTTVAIAKAVADVALKKSGTVTSNSNESFSSPCSEDTLAVPPERPPRRRSSGAGLPPRKKGKAPSPPDHSSMSPIALSKTENETPGVKKCTSEEELCSLSMTENHVEHKMSPNVIKNRYRESPNLCKSSESLTSSQSLEKSRDNSPVTINQVSSPILSKRPPRGHSALCRTPNEQRERACEDKKKNFKSELQSIHLESNKEARVLTKGQQCETNCTEASESIACLDDESRKDNTMESTVKSDTECLPVGPPPRKPPRTFAYDIYRNVKASQSDEEQGEKESGDSHENSQSKAPHAQPIYAVPVKKKNSKKFIAKPPVRSKSDLTNKDISKPSIAPKPAHILSKAKRASVVDPLSSTEKDEEAAITSEFQRQAHIRYSLRRPKKPPPVPPPYPEMEGNAISDSGMSSSNTNTSSKIQADKSCFIYNQRNQHEDIHSCQNAWDSNSNTQEFSEHEHSSSESLNLRRRLHSKCFSPDLSNYEDLKTLAPSVTGTSHSTHNLRTSSPSLQNEQPLSLGYCSVDTPSPDMTDLYKKRSMSDETLYKGSRHGDEPIYATPIFTNSKSSSSHNRQRELHYMCSILFTDEEEADAGRDGTECERKKRRNSTHGKEKMMGTDAADGNRGRSSLISAWKKEFRQSCRQVQNRIKKTVIR